MAKPSMFSKNYDQQMKRRKLNFILLILILISAAFYGGRYYLKKNNIKLFDYEKFNVENKQKNPNKQEAKKPAKKSTNNTAQNKTNTAVDNNSSGQLQFYVYKRKDGKEIKINYNVNSTSKEITGLTDTTNSVVYDIAVDKQKIVFDDNSAGTLILGDVDGNFSTISRDKYISKSSGDEYLKDNVLSRNPWFIWAAKPHFTSEGNIIYVSHLPYIKKGNNLYLWVVKLDGTGHRKVTKLDRDITKITYGSFDENGNLTINSGDKTYLISKDGYDFSGQ